MKICVKTHRQGISLKEEFPLTMFNCISIKMLNTLRQKLSTFLKARMDSKTRQYTVLGHKSRFALIKEVS